MRIKKFHIKNYRPILDSGEVNLDSKITTLMGKNETGKTCILKALESFSPDYAYSQDDLCLHSEVREKIEKNEIDKRDVDMVTIWFEIEPEDESQLTEIDPSLGKIETLKVAKFFDNSYEVEIPRVSLNDFDIPDKKEIDSHFSKIHDATNAFKELLNKHSERHAPFLDSNAEYEDILENIIAYVSDPQRDPNIGTVFNDFYKRLRNLPNRDEKIDGDIERFIKVIELHKDEVKKLFLSREDIKDRILEILPNFMYFADIERLEDTVPISEFLANRQRHKTLSNLIELVGLDVERFKDAGEYDIISKLRSASTTISGLVNQSWTQERLIVSIGIVRDNLVISISDNILTREHPPSIRSQGFQWFLCFYINFAAGSRGEFKNTVILLDDLGMYLHPSGQRDLLKTLEKISDSNQIVFSTHSPFLVDKGKLERTRLVSKKDGKGTWLTQKYST